MASGLGNKNALVNGNRLGHRRRLTVGDLPKEMIAVRHRARAYRRFVEDACMARHNDISVMAAHAIDLACAGEMQSAIAQWILRNRVDKLAPSDLLACAQNITKGKEVRNRCISTLDLDGNTMTAAQALYSYDLTPDDAEPAPEGERAGDGQLGPLKGISEDEGTVEASDSSAE